MAASGILDNPYPSHLVKQVKTRSSAGLAVEEAGRRNKSGYHH